MRLRAALKKHQGSSACNASTIPPTHVIQRWSYRVGKWRESYEIAGIDPASGELSWQQMCEYLGAVERYLEQALAQKTDHPLDPDAWI